ncbi:hypothetical protein COOONC_14610, partial [Cooperia oncophora]
MPILAGKRRRSGLQEGPHNKKSRYDDIEPCSTNSVSEPEVKDAHKRKRQRKRTKGLRELIKNKDNLPPGCTAEKIRRFARRFGTVVEVRIPKSSSRPVSSSVGVVDVGRHLRSFAFLQFTEPEACQRLCEAFLLKASPEKKKEECPSLTPLLQRLLFHIRALSKLRRRRTYAQNVLLMKLRRQQAAIIKMERTANKRTSKISRSISRDKASVAEGQSNGKAVSDNGRVDGEHDVSISNS